MITTARVRGLIYAVALVCASLVGACGYGPMPEKHDDSSSDPGRGAASTSNSNNASPAQ